jgi:hypothetical protein
MQSEIKLNLCQVVKNRVDPDLVDMVARESVMLEVELLARLDGRLADLHMWNRLIDGQQINFFFGVHFYLFIF